MPFWNKKKTSTTNDTGHAGSDEPPREYAYGDSSAKETDAFIKSITSTAPRYGDLEPSRNPSGGLSRGVENDYTQQMTAYRQQFVGEKKLGCGGQCARMYLLIVFAFWLLLGLAGAGGTLYLRYKSDFFGKACTPCKHVTPFFVSGFLVVAVVGIVGVAASIRRGKCLLLTSNVLVCVLFLLFIAWTVVVIMAVAGSFDDKLADGWKSQTTDDAGTICSLQEKLECSGWGSLCVNATSASPVDGCPLCDNTTATTPTPNGYARTCKSLLEKDLKESFTWLLVVGIVGVLVTLSSMCMAWRIRRRPKNEVYAY
eukprot:PhM_4_TR3849/c0_g1_i1/m.48367